MRSRHASLIAARLSIGCARRGSGSAWVNRSLPPCVRNKGYQKSSAGPMPLGPSAVAPTPHAPLPHNWSSRLGLASAALAEAGLLERSHRLGAGIFRYYHKANTPGKRRAVLSTALIVLVTSYATAATAILVFAPTISRVAFGSPEQVTLVRIGGLSLAFESLLLVPFAYL